MIPPAIVRTLTTPLLDPGAFIPTKWDSAEDKAWFGNTILKFIAHDGPRSAFQKRLYGRLSNTFGHIAYNDLVGFFSIIFEDTARKVKFLQQTLQWPCRGDPEYTYSDVVRAVKTRIRASGLLVRPQPLRQPNLDQKKRRRKKDMQHGRPPAAKGGSARPLRWAGQIPA